MANPLVSIKEQGQSIWLDNLTRGMIRGGRLKKLITEDGISGVTSNPAIFNKAMTKGTDYDEEIRTLAEEGKTAAEIYEAMAVKDIQAACDLLRPTYEETQGTDGFVSLEVSPHLARDTQGTIEDAERLWGWVARPNLLVKIPGTPEGLPAIEECLARGININITLLFSLDAHRAVMEAHQKALERRREQGEPLDGVASVASFFLSRIDTNVDKILDGLRERGEHEDETVDLRGTAAVASAKLAYANWKTAYSGDRWATLRGEGARVQKPLWASTSSKDPAYSDVKYVEPLIGLQTINTLPDVTVDAFRDHGRVAATVEQDLEESRKNLERLEALGIAMKQVTDELVEEGIRKFIEPYDALLADLEQKRKTLAPTS